MEPLYLNYRLFNILLKNNVNEIPNNILQIDTYIINSIGVSQLYEIIEILINKVIVLNILKICHASVKKTNIVFDPINFSVIRSSLYLFFQLNSGFQNC